MATETYFAEEKKDEHDGLEDQLENASAIDRTNMIVDHFGADSVTLLTSFGVQSGIMLALVAEACPNVNVLYINTQGPTSERDLAYGRQVLDVLGLKNFTVAKAGATRDEFREGMRAVGIKPDDDRQYQNIFHTLSQDVFKVAPLKKECAASSVRCLLSGVRRGQTKERDNFKFLQFAEGGDPAKGHPILDWSDKQCLEFLRLKDIPPHPEFRGLLQEIIERPPKNNNKPVATLEKRNSQLRSDRPSRGNGVECGIHVQTGGNISSNDPVPPLPNMVVGKMKCRFCIAAKKLLTEMGIDYVEAPVDLFLHLIPSGVTTVPVVYLNKTLIGGYGDLCEHLDVEDTLNTKK